MQKAVSLSCNKLRLRFHDPISIHQSARIIVCTVVARIYADDHFHAVHFAAVLQQGSAQAPCVICCCHFFLHT